jgi:broad-specificity NMP kinase
MAFLKEIRTQITNNLWRLYKTYTPDAYLIEKSLEKQGKTIILDHFAIIDLPSIHSGISMLSTIFSHIGYRLEGQGYLPEKQNDFIWMAEVDALELEATQALPQVVLADFRLDELPPKIKKIIKIYTQQINDDSILTKIKALIKKINAGDTSASNSLINLITNHLTKRDWPTPSLEHFREVSEVNELLAWTLAFGRCPNHFTIAAHLLPKINSLTEFNKFISAELNLPLNQTGGEIKGTAKMGIEQSSTIGAQIKLNLHHQSIDITGPFMEFVWRHPIEYSKNTTPSKWKDYFTGFIAGNANKVIESLYKENTNQSS